jgi:PAS domain S-box-containing protein
VTTFVNPTAAQLLGYDPSELDRATDAHTAPPFHGRTAAPIRPIDCPIYAALHDGVVHRVPRDVFWRKDGTSIPVEYVSTPIIEKGTVAGAVVVFRDITERLEAELAVEESQERFLQLAEHIREVFWITDPAKTRVLYISPGYEEVWGRSCESLYAMPGSWMDAIHPDDRLRVRDAAMSRQISGVVQMRNIASSARMDRCDGSGIAHSRS